MVDSYKRKLQDNILDISKNLKRLVLNPSCGPIPTGIPSMNVIEKHENKAVCHGLLPHMQLSYHILPHICQIISPWRHGKRLTCLATVG